MLESRKQGEMINNTTLAFICGFTVGMFVALTIEGMIQAWLEKK